MYRASGLYIILYWPNCPPGKSSNFAGPCLCQSLHMSSIPMSPWNPFLWCFLEGPWLHTSSCFGVSDAITSLHVVCTPPPQTWGAPCSSSSPRWHGGDRDSALWFLVFGDPGWWVVAVHVTPQPCALCPVACVASHWVPRSRLAGSEVKMHLALCSATGSRGLGPAHAPFTVAGALADLFILLTSNTMPASLCTGQGFPTSP